MPKVSEMTGTAWHKEILTLGDGESKRHKLKCLYYQKNNNYCKHQLLKCLGSSHCLYYKERIQKGMPSDQSRSIDDLNFNHPKEKDEVNDKKVDKQIIQPFEGIKEIPISLIQVPQKYLKNKMMLGSKPCQ